jgi:hypothetical protein
MTKQLAYIVNNATFAAGGGNKQDMISRSDNDTLIVTTRDRIWHYDADMASVESLDWAMISRRVVTIAREHKPERLFVAGHTPAFSPLAAEDDAAQCRVRGAEEELRAALADLKPAPSKIVVYGFRNVAASSVSEVLRGISTQPADLLFERLDKVAQEQGRADAFSNLSVLKHRLIGLFVPVDLEIQGKHLSNSPVGDMTERLRKKISSGLEVLESMAESGVPQKMLSPATNLLREEVVLKRIKDAQSFRGWMDELNDAVDKVRQARARAS